ncbi:MAG: hypothetical protein M1830_009644 [Pleopsidium flavum]|nr:MAG: hypothetical protein M1830_009644 [Pleopsidium flavum]
MSDDGGNTGILNLQTIFAGLQLSLMETPRAELQLQAMQSRGLSPLEVIFSCGVCQDTLKTIYSEPDNNSGLRNTADSTKGTVVKLWLTECAHLTCGKHLEGGGLPFHPDDQPPRAPCPICSGEKGDTTQKALFAVHGVEAGEFDPHIPASYFQLPPVKLDASDPGMDAMRFQYLALIRYGSRILDKLKNAERDKDDLQRIRAVESQAAKRLEGQKGLLGVRVAKLEQQAKEYDTWKEREPQVLHYLSVISPLIRENVDMKEQLRSLGYAVPSTNYALQLADESVIAQRIPRKRSDEDVAVEDDGMDDHDIDTGLGVSHDQHTVTALQNMHNRTPAQLALERVEQLGQSQLKDSQIGQRSSGRKRKHAQMGGDSAYKRRSSREAQIGRRMESRDIMPPPPLPLPRGSEQPRPLNVSNQPFSTPNHRGNISPHQRVFQEQGSREISGLTTQNYEAGSHLVANLPESRSDVTIRSTSGQNRRRSQHFSNAQDEQSPWPFHQEEVNDKENLPSRDLPRDGRPAIGANTLFRPPIRRSVPFYGSAIARPNQLLETYDRSPNRSSQLAYGTSNLFSAIQDGELDRQLLYPRQQQQSARLTPSPLGQRLTLPPPPPTISHNDNPSRQGLFANIHSSAPSESLPHRQPLAFISANRNQSVTPSGQQFYPHTPRRSLGSTQETFADPAVMSRNSRTAVQQLARVHTNTDRRSSSSRLGLAHQSTSPFFADTNRSGNSAHFGTTTSNPRNLMQDFRMDPRAQSPAPSTRNTSASLSFISDPRLSSNRYQHHSSGSVNTTSGLAARFNPPATPRLPPSRYQQGSAFLRQTNSGLFTPAPTTTGSAFRPSGLSGPRGVPRSEGVAITTRREGGVHLGEFLRRDDYESESRGLFTATGRRSVRR